MVRIIADTTSGLPKDMLKELNIPLIPQIVIFGEESFRDDNELDSAGFLQKLKSSPQLPKTAAPPPVLYYPYFERALKDGEDVIVVAPSSKVSGTVRSAESASQDFPELKVHIVDTQTVAGNLASLVLLANEWSSDGASAEKIVERLNEWIPRGHIYFLVATLEYLQKGGRIGGAKALLGEMLQIKPILCVKNGQVEAFEQQRTKKRALARLMEVIMEECPQGPQSHLCVMHAYALEDAQNLVKELKTRLNVVNIPIYELPPAIATHGGPGALAIGFFEA